jgi:type VI secretion system secreted protein VgrG
MCGDSHPHEPASGKCPTDPVTGTVMPCPHCWTDDYKKEVDNAPNGKYYEHYKADGVSTYSIQNVKFKLYVPLKTNSEVVLEVRYKIEAADATVTAADLSTIKANFENGVNAHWNGKFRLQVNHPPDCGTKIFPIKFKIVWLTSRDSGEHYTISVKDVYPREQVDGTIVRVSKSTSVWTAAHEFGHCFGLPDEYSYDAMGGATETVRSYKPDGTLDAAISAPSNKPSSDASATIMSTHSHNSILLRHGWPIAIEAKELLRSKLKRGRTITCDII